jgi:carbamoyltransferase
MFLFIPADGLPGLEIALPGFMATRILGICTEPDGFSAAVVIENRVVAALEQFKIREHWSLREHAVIPREAILASLEIAKVDLARIEVVAFTSESDSTERIIPQIRTVGLNPEATLEHVDPRIAHAAAAFYSSPFDRAAILTLGSEREFTTACLAFGDGGRIEVEDTGVRHSALGALYSQISRALGFNSRTSNKVAWLAATGEPEFLHVFREVMFWGQGKPLSGKLLAEVDLTRRQNVAASLQARTNELVIQTAEDLCRRRNVSNICVAGHLAENPFLVSELEQHFGPDHVFVPAAPGMESLGIGAGLARTSLEMRPEPESRFSHPALGPEFSDSEIKAELENCKLICSFLPCNETLVESTCKAIAAGSLVGWFQGRCEFGHRALGFRSIVANPFAPYIDENINRFLKHRESFHPFVISLPEEAAAEYFHQVGPNARTIASVYVVKDARRELLSKFAVQNVYVRVHTVRATDNPLFWTLLRRMESFTGHPMLINTSFNLPGEPLVLTPRDAIRTFYASGLDLLAMGRFLVTK